MELFFIFDKRIEIGGNILFYDSRNRLNKRRALFNAYVSRNIRSTAISKV